MIVTFFSFMADASFGKVREIPAPWEPYDTDEYAKTYPDQLITIAEMEADARRAIKEE